MIDIKIEDLKELNEEAVLFRVKELEDYQLEELFNDISYYMIEASDKELTKLDNVLKIVEEEIESRNLSIEEMEMMKKLYF